MVWMSAKHLSYRFRVDFYGIDVMGAWFTGQQALQIWFVSVWMELIELSSEIMDGTSRIFVRL